MYFWQGLLSGHVFLINHLKRVNCRKRRFHRHLLLCQLQIRQTYRPRFRRLLLRLNQLVRMVSGLEGKFGFPESDTQGSQRYMRHLRPVNGRWNQAMSLLIQVHRIGVFVGFLFMCGARPAMVSARYIESSETGLCLSLAVGVEERK